MMLLALIVFSAAPAPQKVAALPWSLTKLERELGEFYGDVLARALRSRGVPVTTSREIEALLGAERQRQLLGCSDSSECLIELSNAVGCDAMLLVSAAKLDSTYSANLKVMSARDGRVLVETTAESGSQRGFSAELEGAAERLAAVLGVGRAPASTPTRGLALVPVVLGGVLVAGGGAAVAGAFVEAGAIDARRAATGQVTDQSRTDAQWGKTLQTGGWVLVGVGAASLATGVIWSLLPESTVKPMAFIAPGRIEVGVSVVLP